MHLVPRAENIRRHNRRRQRETDGDEAHGSKAVPAVERMGAEMREKKWTPGNWIIREMPRRGLHEGCDLVNIESDFADGHDFCAI